MIRQIAQLRQLSPEEILFVDDDPAEVRGVAEARCAKTLHVADQRGMTTEDLQTVCDVRLRSISRCFDMKESVRTDHRSQNAIREVDER